MLSLVASGEKTGSGPAPAVVAPAAETAATELIELPAAAGPETATTTTTAPLPVSDTLQVAVESAASQPSGFLVEPWLETTPNIMAGLPDALAASLAPVQALTSPAAPAAPISGWITHYGERFNDRTVGCWNYGDYSSDDPTIIAVNPTLYDELPCGTLLELCGPGGCMIGARKDSCPGCQSNGFDLSEAGFKKVCGDADGVCTASVEVLTVCQVRKFGKSPEEAASLEAEEAALTGRIPCHPES